MSVEYAVRASGLGKCYRVYPEPSARLIEFLSRGKVKKHQEKWALQDVSFDVPRGSAMGVVGANGAGKSTLLKVISGVTQPTTGSYEINGRLSSLLELGADPELRNAQGETATDVAPPTTRVRVERTLKNRKK